MLGGVPSGSPWSSNATTYIPCIFCKWLHPRLLFFYFLVESQKNFPHIVSSLVRSGDPHGWACHALRQVSCSGLKSQDFILFYLKDVTRENMLKLETKMRRVGFSGSRKDTNTRLSRDFSFWILMSFLYSNYIWLLKFLPTATESKAKTTFFFNREKPSALLCVPLTWKCRPVLMKLITW